MNWILADCYIEELANGYVPGEESEEAKEYRAWSWAQKQLEEIRWALKALGIWEETWEC
jgi:hypothetical protein